MALLGQLSTAYDESATPAQLELASALRALHKACSPISMVALGNHLHYSPVTISHYFHARRVPSMTTLEHLHALACRLGRSEPPCTVGDLRRLLAAARRSTARQAIAARPASARRGDRRNSPAVSTPVARGDRRNGKQPVPRAASGSQPEGRAAINRLLGLPPGDRLAALWHVGRQLSSDELAETCAALVRSGLHDEVGVLLDGIRAARNRWAPDA